MALIKCTECENLISDKATTCPNCGVPLDENVAISNNSFAVDDSSSSFINWHSEDDTHVSARCPNCGNSGRIEKSKLKATYSGYELPRQVVCKCGYAFDFIKKPAEVINVANRTIAPQGHNDKKTEPIQLSCTSTNELASAKIPNIPKVLYRITAVVGAPIGTVAAAAAYASNKGYIERGEYKKANSSIGIGIICCLIIAIPCILALIPIIGIIYVGYGLFGVVAVILFGWLLYFIVSKIIIK